MTERENTSGTVNFIAAFFVLLTAADIFVWYSVLSGGPSAKAEINYLDVGQGDAEMVVFPGNVTVLTDAGPDSKITRELDKTKAANGRYIDIAVISHPQLDHFGGFRYLLENYGIGMFVYNGREAETGMKEWSELMNKIKDRNIPVVSLGEGDSVSYNGGKIDFLSPDAKTLAGKDLNDTGLVEMVTVNGMRALMAADIGAATEKYLVGKYDLHADVLKIAHHGSKYSSSRVFLDAVNPAVAIIEVGERNTYGHPARQTLERLSGIRVLRTDKNGTVTAVAYGGKLRFLAGK